MTRNQHDHDDSVCAEMPQPSPRLPHAAGSHRLNELEALSRRPERPPTRADRLPSLFGGADRVESHDIRTCANEHARLSRDSSHWLLGRAPPERPRPRSSRQLLNRGAGRAAARLLPRVDGRKQKPRLSTRARAAERVGTASRANGHEGDPQEGRAEIALAAALMRRAGSHAPLRLESINGSKSRACARADTRMRRPRGA